MTPGLVVGTVHPRSFSSPEDQSLDSNPGGMCGPVVECTGDGERQNCHVPSFRTGKLTDISPPFSCLPSHTTAVLTKMQGSSRPIPIHLSRRVKKDRHCHPDQRRHSSALEPFSSHTHRSDHISIQHSHATGTPSSADSMMNHDILGRWTKGVFRIPPHKKEMNQT